MILYCAELDLLVLFTLRSIEFTDRLERVNFKIDPFISDHVFDNFSFEFIGFI